MCQFTGIAMACDWFVWKLPSMPNWENVHLLSDRLDFLGVKQGPLKPLDSLGLWCLRGFRMAFHCLPPRCREVQVSRTAVRLIFVVFPDWLKFQNALKVCPQIATLQNISPPGIKPRELSRACERKQARWRS